MDARLARFGWGAVCVDGFIPPRAFQEFQALRHPADRRRRFARVEHLPTRPRPTSSTRRRVTRRFCPTPSTRRSCAGIGESRQRAFASPHDRAVLRRHPRALRREGGSARDAERSAGRRARARGARSPQRRAPSEAARSSRLYWWTVEYGLVGTPSDYRLYGAGLLSSLGESHFCHAPDVRKLAARRRVRRGRLRHHAPAAAAVRRARLRRS